MTNPTLETYAVQRGLEGASGITATVRKLAKSLFKSKVKKEAEASGLTQFLDRVGFGSLPIRQKAQFPDKMATSRGV